MDIIERLKFDASRCEAVYSKGIATNIEEAIKEIKRLRTALQHIGDGRIIQGMSPALFAQKVLNG